MRELKPIKIMMSQPDSVGTIHKTPCDVYLKSEADKVIAELIEKNERLSDDCLIKASNTFREIEKEIRHHKYKRCLGIAAVCFEKSYSTTLVKYDKESGYRLNFYDWWGKRWLELAEEPTWARFLQLIHKEAK